jgi:ribonuclease HII
VTTLSRAIRQSEFPHLNKEIALFRQGYCCVAGLDEAGRGAWAGPVVAAAVILPVDRPYSLRQALHGLDDSKRLSRQERERLFKVIRQVALGIAVGMASPAMVDAVNVVAATRCAMQQALENLDPPPDYLLLDHLRLPAIALPQDAFPKADSISLTVAAASVIAKVTRDRLMVAYNQEYPGYAFDRHKGYGTRAHQLALAEHGPCPLHRLSYQPLRVYCGPAEKLEE